MAGNLKSVGEGRKLNEQEPSKLFLFAVNINKAFDHCQVVWKGFSGMMESGMFGKVGRAMAR
jgi:hypothetical protein